MRKILRVILLLYLTSSSLCLRNLFELKETLSPETYKILEEVSKFSEVYQVEPGDKLDKSELQKNAELGALPPLMIAYGAVKAASLLYKGICFLFGHSKKTSWTDIPMEKGFDKVDQHILQYQLKEIYPGKQCENLDKVVNAIVSLSKIKKDPENIEKIRHAFKMAKYSDAKASQKKDFFFNGAEPGTVDFLSIMIFKGNADGWVEPKDYQGPDAPLCTEYDRYYVSLVWMTAAFKINSDVRMVRTDEKWGIFKSKISEQLESVPRGMVAEDIDSLFTFYNIITLKHMCDFFDVPYEWPKIQYKYNNK